MNTESSLDSISPWVGNKVEDLCFGSKKALGEMPGASLHVLEYFRNTPIH